MSVLRLFFSATLIGAGLFCSLLLASYLINEYSLYLGLALLLVLDACILYYASRVANTVWESYRAWLYLQRHEPTSLGYCLRKRLTPGQVRQAHDLHRHVHRSGDDTHYCQLTIKDFLEETK